MVPAATSRTKNRVSPIVLKYATLNPAKRRSCPTSCTSPPRTFISRAMPSLCARARHKLTKGPIVSPRCCASGHLASSIRHSGRDDRCGRCGRRASRAAHRAPSRQRRGGLSARPLCEAGMLRREDRTKVVASTIRLGSAADTRIPSADNLSRAAFRLRLPGVLSGSAPGAELTPSANRGTQPATSRPRRRHHHVSEKQELPCRGGSLASEAFLPFSRLPLALCELNPRLLSPLQLPCVIL